MEKQSQSNQHTSKAKLGDPPPQSPHSNKTPAPKPSTTQTHDHVRDTRGVKTDRPTPAPANSIPPAPPRNPPPSDYQKAGPGFPHSVTHYPGGWSHSTLTGITPPVPQPFAQQVPGLAPQVQTPGFFYQQSPSSTSYPYFYQPNFTEQPVPSLANGPMQHVWRPRFDGPACVPGVQPVQMVGAPGIAILEPAVPAVPAFPVAVPIHQVQPGGIIGQPVAMPAMVYPGQQQQQQYYMQPGQIPPGPPPHVTGQPSQFLPGQPGQPAPLGAPQPVHFMANPGQGQFPPGAFPQAGQPPFMQGPPAAGFPGVQNLPPDIMGLGKTRSEFAMEQASAAANNEANQPQDFQPADSSPSRMYWVRQLDGEWIQMSRATVDRLSCRWYIWPSGVFYAIRLED